MVAESFEGSLADPFAQGLGRVVDAGDVFHGQAARAATEITAQAEQSGLRGAKRQAADACVRYLTGHLSTSGRNRVGRLLVEPGAGNADAGGRKSLHRTPLGLLAGAIDSDVERA